MPRRHITLAIIVFVSLLSGISGILGNIASNMLPERLLSYLWLAWPLWGICTVIAIVLSIWQYSRDQPTEALSVPEAMRYRKYETLLESFESNDNLSIIEIRYGDSVGIEHVYGRSLVTLPSEVVLPKDFVASEGREAYLLKSLRGELTTTGAGEDKHFYYPREITVLGRRSHIGTTIAVYICTDTFYFQGCHKSLISKDFEVSCLLGRGGISEFVDKDGHFQDNQFVVGNGLGTIGVIVALELRRGKPIGRSKYVLVIRKGIRYPDDIWLSKKTRKPITSATKRDISEARFIFQSRQPNAGGTDIFVADFNGGRMYNITHKEEIAYDGFYDNEGNEVARWVDGRSVQYCSMRKGKRIIRSSLDPIHE